MKCGTIKQVRSISLHRSGQLKTIVQKVSKCLKKNRAGDKFVQKQFEAFFVFQSEWLFEKQSRMIFQNKKERNCFSKISRKYFFVSRIVAFFTLICRCWGNRRVQAELACACARIKQNFDEVNYDKKKTRRRRKGLAWQNFTLSKTFEAIVSKPFCSTTILLLQSLVLTYLASHIHPYSNLCFISMVHHILDLLPQTYRPNVSGQGLSTREPWRLVV